MSSKKAVSRVSHGRNRLTRPTCLRSHRSPRTKASQGRDPDIEHRFGWRLPAESAKAHLPDLPDLSDLPYFVTVTVTSS